MKEASASLTDLLDETDAAHALGVARTTLANWRRRGVGPTCVRLGRLVRYRREDLLTFVEARTIDPPRHPFTVHVRGKA